MSEAGLYVPFSVFDELEAEREAAQSFDLQRAHDAPIDYLGWSGSNAAAPKLGNQPSLDKLLNEGVAGWAATAGTAVASRISGLASYLTVGTETTDDQGKQQVEAENDHVLSVALQNPNPIFSLSDMLWVLAWHLQQGGLGYWQILRDPFGTPVEFWPLLPQAVGMISSQTDVIAGYSVRDANGSIFTLETDEIVRFWRPNPYDLYSTIGKLGPQQVEFDAERAMQDHYKQHFEGDASPRVIFTAEKGVSLPSGQDAEGKPTSQGKDFLKRWRQQYGAQRGSQRGLPAFVPPGFNVTELAAHGGTKDINEMSQQKAEQIMAAYGVPDIALGRSKDVNRSTAEAGLVMFDVNTNMPLTNLMADSITNQVARKMDPSLVVFFADYVKADREQERADEAHDAAIMVKSPQQILAGRAGEDPDSAPWGEFPPSPIGTVPYTGENRFDSMASPDQPRGLPQCGVCGDRSESVADVRRLERQSVAPVEMFRADVRNSEDQQDRMVSDEKRYVPSTSRAILRVLDAQYEALSRRLLDFPPVEFAGRGMRGVIAHHTDRALGDELFDPRTWDEMFVTEVGPELGIALEETANRGYVDIRTIFEGAEQPWRHAQTLTTLSEQAVRRQAFVLSTNMAENVNASTLDFVKQSLEISLRDDETVDQAAKRLRQHFGRKRARTIARTEVLGATEQGQLEGWKATGEVAKRAWYNSRVGVRPSHFVNGHGQPMDGYQVGIDEDFILGSGNRANAPRDPRLPAGDRVNCRCGTVAVIPGL